MLGIFHTGLLGDARKVQYKRDLVQYKRDLVQYKRDLVQYKRDLVHILVHAHSACAAGW